MIFTKRFRTPFKLTSKQWFGTQQGTTGLYPKWWVAKINGRHPKMVFDRDFLKTAYTTSDDKALYFGSLIVGDIIEVGTSRGSSKSYFKVRGISFATLELDTISRSFVDMYFARKGKTQQPPPNAPKGQQMPTRLLKSELTGYYRDWIKEPDTTVRISYLANAVGWMDRAVKRTVAQHQLPSNANKKYTTVQKLRTLASHENTPPQEAETAVLMALQLMEGIVIQDLLPVLNLDIARAKRKEYLQTGSVYIPPQPAVQGTPFTPSYGQTQYTNDILTDFAESIADMINAITGMSRAFVKATAQINVCIHGERKMAFTMVGNAKRMRINCMYFPQILKDQVSGEVWTYQTDSKGYHYLIQKPADLADAKAIAQAVAEQVL